MFFTRKQIHDIAVKINDYIDIPYVPENFEQRLFETAIEKFDMVISELLPVPFRALLNATFLEENPATADLKQRLTQKINQKIDLPFLSETKEAYLIEFCLDLLFSTFFSTNCFDTVLNFYSPKKFGESTLYYPQGVSKSNLRYPKEVSESSAADKTGQ